MNVKCQACGATFIAPDEKIRGRVLTYKCRRCGAAMRVDGTQLVSAEHRDMENEERESYLPMAPGASFSPMGQEPGKSVPADVESGWSEPADVLNQASIPPVGTFKSPGLPKDLTPPTPDASVSTEGERATLMGSSATLVAKMMDVPHEDSRSSAVPTARKPDLAELAASSLATGETASDAPATAKAPPVGEATVPGVAIDDDAKTKAGPTEQTPTPLQAKAAVDLTPTPLFAGKASPKAATAPAATKPIAKAPTPAAPAVTPKAATPAARPAPTPAAPAKAAGGKLFDATPQTDDDDRVFLIGTSAKKPAPAAATTEDSGLFDLRALTGGADPTPPPKPVAHKPPPPARPLPPKPGAASPAKPPPPKPPKPKAVEIELDQSLEMELDAGDEDETVPTPAVRPDAPAKPGAAPQKDKKIDEPTPSPVAVAPVAAEGAAAAEPIDVDVPEPPPSSESAPVSLSEVEDAPPSSEGVTEVSLGDVEPSTDRGGDAPLDATDEMPASERSAPEPTGPLSQGETEPLPLLAKATPKEKSPSQPDLGPAADKKPTPPAKNKKVDEDDPFAPLGAVAPLAAPAVAESTTRITERPPASRKSRPPTPEEVGRGGGSKAPYIIGGLLLLGGAAIFAATRGGEAPATTADATTTATTAATATATGDRPKPEGDTAAATGTATATTTAEPVAAKEEPSKPSGSGTNPGTGSGAASKDPKPAPEGDHAKPAAVAAAEPAGTPSPTKAEPAEPTKPAEPSKPAEVTPTPVKPLPPAVGTAPIDKAAVASAMGAAASAAAGCKPADGTGGVARVSVTFATSGRATQALVNGPPFAGTPTGGCIAAKFRSATIPPFSGDPVTAHKTVSF
jgi:hypothetical protein